MTKVDQMPGAARPVTPLGLIVAQLAQITASARALGYADPNFNHLLQQVMALAGGLDPYVAAGSTPESPALAQLTAHTQSEDWAGRFARGETAVELEQEMLSGHVEGQFLKMLVHGLNAKKILEIGLFTGYSALAMAEALPEDGTLLAFEMDVFAARFASEQFARSSHGKKIRVQVGPAMASLRTLSAPFELIFIDADKVSYLTYVQTIIEKNLLTPNGLICVDNTLMQGLPYLDGETTANGKAIASFNEAIKNDSRLEQVILPLRDGITLIRLV